MKTLFKFYLFFLPFTYGLTLNVGFPLKISEGLLLFMVFLIFLKGKISSFTFRKFPELIIFLIIVSISFIVNKNNVVKPDLFDYRISPIGDSLLRLLYIYFNIIAFFVAFEFLRKDLLILKSWINGAIVAAIYGWHLLIFSLIGIDYFLLPGMTEPLQTFHGIVRTGPFQEGNFFALYLLLSGAIAWFLNNKKASLFLFFSILSTFSTIGIFGVFLFFGVYYAKAIFKKRTLVKILYTLPLFLILLVYLLNNPTFKSVLVDKLQPIKNVNTSNGSAADRYSTSKAAFKMGIDNLFFGVGPYNFGNEYLDYLDFDDFESITQTMKDYIKYKGLRKIPNNIYLEVFSEYGVFAFFLFLFFLYHIYQFTGFIKERGIKAGFISLLFCFNAFPSFIMLFIWTFLAIPIAIYSNKALTTKEIF